MLSKRNKYSDFIVPTLETLVSLGGKAWLSEIEQEFYRRYHSLLDPDIDWNKTTRNHHKQLWQDCCGSRVAYWQLKPKGYISIENHGSKGSIWEITQLGAQLVSNIK